MTQIHIFFHALEKGVASLSAKLPQWPNAPFNQTQNKILFKNPATDVLENAKGITC